MLTPDWVSCGSCAGGDLPWKLEVLLQGRGSRGKNAAGPKKALPEARLAAHETSLLCPSFLHLHRTLTLGSVYAPYPLGFRKTCCTVKTSWWDSWTLRGKGEKPLSTLFLGLGGTKGLSQPRCFPLAGLRTGGGRGTRPP